MIRHAELVSASVKNISVYSGASPEWLNFLYKEKI